MERELGRSTRNIGFQFYKVNQHAARMQDRLTCLQAYLGLARALLDVATLQNAIKLEAPVLVDRRERIQDEM